MDFERWRKNAFTVGAVSLTLTAIGLFISREQFFRSYLWAFLFWFSLGMGCLPLLMLYHLVGGSWGFTIRRVMESGARTLPTLAILFVPILFGVHYLYEWSQPEVLAQSAIIARKHAYLNTPFWIIRALIYFAVWLYYASRLNRLSALEDETGDITLATRFQRLSAPGLLVYAVTVTFALFDWAMSLEPEWYSSIYGLLWIVNQALSALAVSILAVAYLSDRPPLSRVVVPGTLNDLGNLLFAFVMLWAYLSFAQFLIIWSGNLPEEIHWYLRRLDNGWQWIAAIVLVFHFAAPFLLLLARFNKRHAQRLATIAFLVLVMRAVDTFWNITPAFYGDGITIHVLDVFALVGIGGLWIASFVGALRTAPLLPLHDPNTAPHKAL
jgi:hypothetical protein